MVDSFYIVREQGECRQADGNFNIYNARRESREKGEVVATLHSPC